MASEEAQSVLGECMIMGEISIIHAMHPEKGELVFIADVVDNDQDTGIALAEKLKVLEMAKLRVSAQIMAGFEM